MILLKLRAGYLFAICCGLMILSFPLAIVAQIFSSNDEIMHAVSIIVRVFMGGSITSYIFWNFSIFHFFNRNALGRSSKFKIRLVYFLYVYIVIQLLILVLLPKSIFENLIFVLLYVSSFVIAFFYLLLTNGKILNFLQSKINVPNYKPLINLLLIWFFSIGVWILQPAIKKVYYNKNG